MRQIIRSNTFEKSLKRALRRPDFNHSELLLIINKLAAAQALEYKHRDHVLTGRYAGSRECHIAFDMLLIYRVYHKERVVLLEDIGTHVELFGR